MKFREIPDSILGKVLSIFARVALMYESSIRRSGIGIAEKT